MLKFLILLLILIIVVVVNSYDDDDDEPAAKMFLYKYTDTDPIVEGKSLIITYKVVNNGNAIARDIKITEKYDKTSFEFLKDVNDDGNASFSLEELAPGTEMTFNIELIPKIKGRYGYEYPERAKMTYIANAITIDDTDDDIRVSYSTNVKLRIIDSAEHQRNISYNLKEWGLFFILYFIPIILSLSSWKSASDIINKSTVIKTTNNNSIKDTKKDK